jgi:hypothetical protein
MGSPEQSAEAKRTSPHHVPASEYMGAVHDSFSSIVVSDRSMAEGPEGRVPPMMHAEPEPSA